MIDDTVKRLSDAANLVARLAELCREAKLRLRDLRQMLPYTIDDEQRAALENQIETWARITDRLDGMSEQVSGLEFHRC